MEPRNGVGKVEDSELPVAGRRQPLERGLHSIETASGKGAEDANDNAREDQTTQDGLQEDGVLDLAESGLLDPDLAVEDLSDDVALLILGHPGFVFVAVAGPERLEGSAFHVEL